MSNQKSVDSLISLLSGWGSADSIEMEGSEIRYISQILKYLDQQLKDKDKKLSLCRHSLKVKNCRIKQLELDNETLENNCLFGCDGKGVKES